MSRRALIFATYLLCFPLGCQMSPVRDVAVPAALGVIVTEHPGLEVGMFLSLRVPDSDAAEDLRLWVRENIDESLTRTKAILGRDPLNPRGQSYLWALYRSLDLRTLELVEWLWDWDASSSSESTPTGRYAAAIAMSLLGDGPNPFNAAKELRRRFERTRLAPYVASLFDRSGRRHWLSQSMRTDYLFELIRNPSFFPARQDTSLPLPDYGKKYSAIGPRFCINDFIDLGRQALPALCDGLFDKDKRVRATCQYCIEHIMSSDLTQTCGYTFETDAHSKAVVDATRQLVLSRLK